MPKFSIVTIVLNHPEGLAATAKSVAEQKGGNFQWIVVDGGSKQPTQDVISAYSDRIDVLVSEPDNGLYDAMNKGLDLAEGDWVIFMNAGDRFAHARVLASFMASDDEALAYGYAVWHPVNGKPFVFRGRPLSQLWRGICFSHQALFARTSLAKGLRFRTKYRIAADYDFCVRAIFGGAKVRQLNYTVADIEPGGLSENAYYRRTWERFRIVIHHYSPDRVVSYYARLMLGKWLDDRRSRLRSGATA